jgi:hypothetical protein
MPMTLPFSTTRRHPISHQANRACIGRVAGPIVKALWAVNALAGAFKADGFFAFQKSFFSFFQNPNRQDYVGPDRIHAS